MKKLILILSLLLSSLNLSATPAELLKDTNAFVENRYSFEKQKEFVQDSYISYATFKRYNEQQKQKNQDSRVSDGLIMESKMLAMYDYIQFAISETLIAAVFRDETITENDPLLPEDVERGIARASLLITPKKKTDLYQAFSKNDLSSMKYIVEDYVLFEYNNDYYNYADRDSTRNYIIYRLLNTYFKSFVEMKAKLSEEEWRRHDRLFHSLANKLMLGRDMRDSLLFSQKFTRDIATTFTNLNAIQSTCPGGGSCASPM